jgi:hypothetical protein
MNFNYEEIGTFNAEKAAKGLIELANKLKPNVEDKKEDKKD